MCLNIQQKVQTQNKLVLPNIWKPLFKQRDFYILDPLPMNQKVKVTSFIFQTISSKMFSLAPKEEGYYNMKQWSI